MQTLNCSMWDRVPWPGNETKPPALGKDGEVLYSQQKQDRELTVAPIMNTLLENSDLKKVGKTTKPFGYELNQIP